jgi:predicted ATPase
MRSERAPNNLPAQLTSFVGREDELAVLRTLVAETRLVTLTGSGGCGKTRLATELGATALGQHPDGVWLVDLAPIVDVDHVASAALRALGLREDQTRDPVDVLAGHLRRRRSMLILDNCEHLVAACAGLAEAVLRCCPAVDVLATSREPLAVAGELTWRVPSLSVPTEWDSLHPDTVGRYEAVRLFVDRARRAHPQFGLCDDNAPAVAEVCRRLDGIPLAIELAAARTHLLTAP